MLSIHDDFLIGGDRKNIIQLQGSWVYPERMKWLFSSSPLSIFMLFPADCPVGKYSFHKAWTDLTRGDEDQENDISEMVMFQLKRKRPPV